MKSFLKVHYLKIVGIIIGMFGGYLYYYFIGCSSGTCPITSNPYFSIAYGAILGYLLFSLFKRKKTTGDNSEGEKDV